MERRNFIKLGALSTLFYGSNLVSCVQRQRAGAIDSDILVVGATPAGIMAAIAAARLGSRVILAEYHYHVGGMSTSGLGKSDIENKDAIAGLFREFTEAVKTYYINTYGAGSEHVKCCRDGYYYEPSVAEFVFNNMISAEQNIRVLLGHRIEKVSVQDQTIQEIGFHDRKKKRDVKLRASVFIDATYEGDVFGLSGAAFALGREGNGDFNEAHAGKIFFDYNDKVKLAGSTGEGDKRLPAYTYRLCLTDDPENSVPLKAPPEDYDRNRYVKYFEDLAEDRLSGPKVFREGHGYYAAHFNTMMRAFSFAEIPGRKFDVNINPRPLGFPFPGENSNYIEAGWEQRERVYRHHRNLVLGLLYFVQNDPDIPEAHRKIANQYHLPKDEFTDNENFPWQLYVREGRRLKGKYMLTENDVTFKESGRNTIFSDSIIAGEFPIDSFPVSKEPSVDRKVLEGYIGLLPVSPYQIPYRILIPEKIKGLIVPVAASTTHVAYSTVRMEPLWMGLGQVAGVAAWLSISRQTPVGDIPVDQLQGKLLEYNQILTYFEDIATDDIAFKAVQFWGTKGFFDSYRCRPHDALDPDTSRRWHAIVCKLAGWKVDEMLVQDGFVSIKQFREVLMHLVGNSLEHIFNNNRQIYSRRDENSFIRRGEACILFYDAYFSNIKDATRSI